MPQRLRRRRLQPQAFSLRAVEAVPAPPCRFLGPTWQPCLRRRPGKILEGRWSVAGSAARPWAGGVARDPSDVLDFPFKI